MSNTAKRDFDLADVLSVTTGILVSSRLMDALYDVIGFVTGNEEISTVTLVMLGGRAKKTIFEQHPELEPVKFPGFKNVHKENQVKFVNDWLAEQKSRFGDTVSILPEGVSRAVSFNEQMRFAVIQKTYGSAKREVACLKAQGLKGRKLARRANRVFRKVKHIEKVLAL